jgi:hypothetical protein
MAFQNVGTMTLDTVSSGAKGGMAMDAAGIASGQAFLVSELEKRDTLVRTPLTSFTYSRDLPIRVGGGWDEFVSAISVGYGVTGGSGDGLVNAPGSNGIPMVQANFDKGTFKTHIVSAGTRVMWLDMQRGNMTGRNMDTLLRDGLRLAYDKHLDQNAYLGFTAYGTTGLVNNANVTATQAALNAGGTSRAWKDKNADEILEDINTAILDVWEAAEYDLDAVPNHIILPYAQYNYIATTKVSSLAEKTILTFLLENNVATANGSDLFIGATSWCKGAGTGSSDRMVVYCNKERYVAMDELVPLTRAMTTPNTESFCYDTAYAANVSEVEIFYDQTIAYVDGI